MPSRALRLLHILPSFVIGGVQARLLQLVPLLDERWTHTVVALDGRIDALHGCQTDRLQSLSVAGTPAGTLAGLPRRIEWLRRLRPDVLLTYNWGAIDWAIANALVRRPHVHVEDGFGKDEALRRQPRRNHTRAVALRANRSRLVVPSSNLLRIARAEWRAPAAHTVLIPNGVDLGRYADVGRRGRPSRFARQPDEMVIGTAARIRPEKCLERMIDALAIVRRERPARLVIAGDGPEMPMLRQHAASVDMAEHVEWIGHQADIAPTLHELDVFAMSSDTEQMPIVVVEAMACGLPVVSTDVGDVRAMVASSNQPFVVERQPEALAGGVLRLGTNPDLRASVGADNRTIARGRYDERQMSACWQDVIVSVAG